MSSTWTDPSSFFMVCLHKMLLFLVFGFPSPLLDVDDTLVLTQPSPSPQPLTIVDGHVNPFWHSVFNVMTKASAFRPNREERTIVFTEGPHEFLLQMAL